jgi:hypothetical protein
MKKQQKRLVGTLQTRIGYWVWKTEGKARTLLMITFANLCTFCYFMAVSI